VTASPPAGGRTADDLREENARLWAELHRLRAQQREVEYLERLVTQMETSVSWRITSPLRIAKRLSGKARKKLDERRG
jgi:hypothetical protein